MKKYLTIASVLGVIAFASVSFLAQADQQPAGAHTAVAAEEKAAAPAAADPSDGEAAADNAAAASTPADDKFAKDDQDCATDATTPGKDGAVPTDADKDAAYKNCMQKKGHSAAELKAQGGGSDPGKADDGKSDTHEEGSPSEE